MDVNDDETLDYGTRFLIHQFWIILRKYKRDKFCRIFENDALENKSQPLEWKIRRWIL